MSLFNAEVIISEFTLSPKRRILSVKVKDSVNETEMLFKVNETFCVFDDIKQDYELIIDRVIPFIKKYLVKQCPVSISLCGIENLYLNAFFKINNGLMNRFNRGASRFKNFNVMKSGTDMLNLLSGYQVCCENGAIFQIKNIKMEKYVKDFSESKSEEKLIINTANKCNIVFMNQTVLKDEKLSVITCKSGVKIKNFVCGQNQNIFSSVMSEIKEDLTHEKTIVMLNKSFLNGYSDSTRSNVMRYFESGENIFIAYLDDKIINKTVSAINTLNQLDESKTIFLGNGEALYKEIKEAERKTQQEKIEFEEKQNAIINQGKIIKAQFVLKNGYFYAKGIHVVNGHVLNRVMLSSISLKNLYTQMKKMLNKGSESFGYIFYLDKNVEKKLKKNAIEATSYEDYLFVNTLNEDSELCFDLEKGDDRHFKVVPHILPVKSDKVRVKIESPNLEIQERLKSLESKKSEHVATYIYFRESEDKSLFNFYTAVRSFSEKGKRLLDFKSISIIKKTGLFDNRITFMNAIKGCLKHVNKSASKEVVFLYDQKTEHVKDFKKLFTVINEHQYNHEGALFNIRHVSTLDSDMIYALRGEVEKAKEDDKSHLLASEKHEDETIYIYSDASYKEHNSLKKFGYGIVLLKGDVVLSEYTGVDMSPYTVSADTSEFNAILFALKKVREMKASGLIPMGMKIEVRSDCLNAIRFYDNNLDRLKLNKNDSLNEVYDLDVLKAQVILNKAELAGLVSFKWIKGHNDQTYNERADFLAREAYQEEVICA
ncbi:RNase H family protein [Serratia sp. Se-RSBMAAmG]|uniref:ribonuclease HI n=1 Tax=Serratia sp. Se-RSBMAAmG TaxID=3043305 RepID=UPI0024AE9832|nr:RNase H family protein [Serratia sp. Se-RSBMAAmG]MDI6976218.1 hypothetical protein [Serratia sp. Se-RSBMAAmG]